MTEDYIPSTEEHEHEKSFAIAKAKDPNQLKAIRLREQACDDTALDDGAVRLFVRLLDLSLHPFLNQGKTGQIIISQQKLGCFIGCDERTVRRRTSRLIELNYVWTTQVPLPNMKPITCYHVTAFQGTQEVREVIPGGGLMGNGKRRHDSGFARTGKEAAGRQTGHQRRVTGGLVDIRGNPISSVLLGFSADNGQETPLSAVKFDRSDRTPVSSPSGQNCPLTPDTSVLSQRSDLTAGSGQNCPLTPVGNVRHIETQKEVESSFQSKRGGGEAEKTPPPPKAAPGDWGADGFGKWCAEMRDMFQGKRSKVQQELEGLLEHAKSPSRRAEIKRRLAFLRDLRRGGLPPDEEAPPTAPGKATARVEISEEQLLKDALAMMESAAEAGLKPLLTPKHRAALEKAGVAL